MNAALAQFTVADPVARQRPWVSDQRWLAHESLPVFSQIAGQLPHNGLWSMTPRGARCVGEKFPDLGAMLDVWFEASEPCDLGEVVQRFYGLEAVPLVEVEDPEGRTWVFDAALLAPVRLSSGWSWRLHVGAGFAALIGVDRKGRPRFACANWVTPEQFAEAEAENDAEPEQSEEAA